MSMISLAKQLFRLLKQHGTRIVFAESCTAGLVSATLARVPGVSQWHCGSAVTYRSETKTEWLDVSEATLKRHTAVSEPVARQMAVGVLKKTPEAGLSAAITGHLGPDAPTDLDGVVYIGIARRAGKKIKAVGVWRHQLQQQTRLQRQKEAVTLIFEQLLAEL